MDAFEKQLLELSYKIYEISFLLYFNTRRRELAQIFPLIIAVRIALYETIGTLSSNTMHNPVYRRSTIALKVI
jgi:hypothetical protein